MKEQHLTVAEETEILTDGEMSLVLEQIHDAFMGLAYGNIVCPQESVYSWIAEIENPEHFRSLHKERYKAEIMIEFAQFRRLTEFEKIVKQVCCQQLPPDKTIRMIRQFRAQCTRSRIVNAREKIRNFVDELTKGGSALSGDEAKEALVELHDSYEPSNTDELNSIWLDKPCHVLGGVFERKDERI